MLFERKNLQYWAEKGVGLALKLRKATADIGAAEVAAGERLLDESTEGDPIADLSRAHAEIAALSAASRGAEARRLETIKAKRAEDAAGFRKAAADKRGELETLDRRTAKVLAALSRLQGVAYTDIILSSQPRAELVSQGYLTPRSARIRLEIVDLEQRADNIAGADLSSDGVFDTCDLVPADSIRDPKELALAILSRPQIVPSAASILDWVESVASNSDRGPFGDYPRRYRLIWHDGLIDARESYIFVGALAPDNPTAATFRAVPRTPEERMIIAYNDARIPPAVAESSSPSQLLSSTDAHYVQGLRPEAQ